MEARHRAGLVLLSPRADHYAQREDRRQRLLYGHKDRSSRRLVLDREDCSAVDSGPQNVLDHLPDRQRPWAKAIWQRTYRCPQPGHRPASAPRAWHVAWRPSIPAPARACARGWRKPSRCSGAISRTRYGDSWTTTNAAESLISRTRHVKRHVTRWRGRPMVVTLGRRRCARSRQRLPSIEGAQSDAAAGGRIAGTRSTARHPRGRGQRRVSRQPSGRCISTDCGTPP